MIGSLPDHLTDRLRAPIKVRPMIGIAGGRIKFVQPVPSGGDTPRKTFEP